MTERPTQRDLNTAVLGFLTSHPVFGPLLRDGAIQVTSSDHRINLKLPTIQRPAVRALAEELHRLQVEGPLTQTELARELGMSQSSTIRMLLGEVMPKWLAVRVLGELLGGDPLKLRRLWDAAEAEAKRPSVNDA